MNKVKKSIDWANYTINSVKGLCPVGCSFCYARRLYKRFHWNPEIRFEPAVFNDLPKMKPGSRVFWGSTMELFGYWINPAWMRLTMERVKAHPELTHIFLTKRPQNLLTWSPFPDNCYVGVTCTDEIMLTKAYVPLKQIQSKVKFISFEPLLNADMSVVDLSWTLRDAEIAQVIIGQQTPVKQSTMPKIELVREIVEAADEAGAKVFLKNNLESLFEVKKGEKWDVPNWASSGEYGHTMLRQEVLG